MELTTKNETAIKVEDTFRSPHLDNLPSTLLQKKCLAFDNRKELVSGYSVIR